MVYVWGWVQIVSDLQSCQEKVLMRWKASPDASERWFGAPSAGLPTAGAIAGRDGVRISNVLREGPVEHVVVPEPSAS